MLKKELITCLNCGEHKEQWIYKQGKYCSRKCYYASAGDRSKLKSRGKKKILIYIDNKLKNSVERYCLNNRVTVTGLVEEYVRGVM